MTTDTFKLDLSMGADHLDTFHAFAQKLRGQDDWQLFDLPTHHHLMLSMPQETDDAITG